MKTEKKFIGIKEVVTIVLFSVLSIVVGMVTGIPFMASPTWSVLGGYSLMSLINGMVYVLMITKSPVGGTNFLFLGVKVLYVLLLGAVPTALVYLVGAFICEAITWNNGYQKPVVAGISYSLHNVIFGIGSFTPMILNPESYAQQMRDYGMDEEMVHEMVYGLVEPSMLALVTLLIVIFSVIGMFLGVKMMKKHFQPAGVAS